MSIFFETRTDLVVNGSLRLSYNTFGITLTSFLLAVATEFPPYGTTAFEKKSEWWSSQQFMIVISLLSKPMNGLGNQATRAG